MYVQGQDDVNEKPYVQGQDDVNEKPCMYKDKTIQCLKETGQR